MAKHGSHSVSFGRCELLKRSIGARGGGGGGGGNENKNKFEKLNANRSQSKERRFVPKCRRKNLLGFFVVAMTTSASTSGNFKAISSSSLSFEAGIGEKGGCHIQSVINEHFKRPNCGR